MPIIKGPQQLVGKHIEKTLPKLGGPSPGAAADGLPHLGRSEPSAPQEKKGSPDKRGK